jgi:hypothetical protein
MRLFAGMNFARRTQAERLELAVKATAKVFQQQKTPRGRTKAWGRKKRVPDQLCISRPFGHNSI